MRYGAVVIGLTVMIGAAMACSGGEDWVDDDSVIYYQADDGAYYPSAVESRLGVDASRDGRIDFDDPDDMDHRLEPDDGFGALFLANINDDAGACEATSSDDALMNCFDGTNHRIANASDLEKMARIETEAADVGPGVTARLEINEEAKDHVHLYWRSLADDEDPEAFEPYRPGEDVLERDVIRQGVEFAIEGRSLVDPVAGWDGEVELSWVIDIPALEREAVDRATMEQAPVLFRNHLQEARRVYAAELSQGANSEFLEDLARATNEAGVEDGLHLLDTEDPWVQDYLLVGYTSMPGPEGAIELPVYFRSANIAYPESLRPVVQAVYDAQNAPFPEQPLRAAGRLAYTEFHGSMAAGQTQFDPEKGFSPVDTDDVDVDDVISYLFGQNSDEEYPEIAALYDAVSSSDTLDSFGNTEVIPPHVAPDGEAYPHGRVLRGRSLSEDHIRPDPTLSDMIDAQGEQPVVWIDTFWLSVAHVDETISFVDSDSDRGWAMLYADPLRAEALLEDLESQGHGQAVLFAGKSWPRGGSAAVTVSETLDDPDIRDANARAALEVQDQVEIIKDEVGLEDEETYPVGFLMEDSGWGLVAYQPGIINGISLKPDEFGAPDPHGPRIDGVDPFRADAEEVLGELGVNLHWIETWDVYHVGSGQVHCGSNTSRVAPMSRWWQQ